MSFEVVAVVTPSLELNMDESKKAAALLIGDGDGEGVGVERDIMMFGTFMDGVGELVESVVVWLRGLRGGHRSEMKVDGNLLQKKECNIRILLERMWEEVVGVGKERKY